MTRPNLDRSTKFGSFDGKSVRLCCCFSVCMEYLQSRRAAFQEHVPGRGCIGNAGVRLTDTSPRMYLKSCSVKDDNKFEHRILGMSMAVSSKILMIKCPEDIAIRIGETRYIFIFTTNGRSYAFYVGDMEPQPFCKNGRSTTIAE
jgi:hypothetical protein